jgi:CBS domain-containing protein
MKVRDVMTYGVISVSENASIAEAIETMLRSRVSALVVFDADHALSGILSEGDLLRRSELGSEPKRPYWLELLIGSGRLADAYAHEHGRKAGEIMTRDVETITEDAELSVAVDRMIHRRIKRLPVLRGETLVGIVSRSDLLKGLLAATPSANAEHSDAEIKAAILAELDKLEWGAACERERRGSERRRHLRRLDHRRAAAQRPQGDRREYAWLRRRPRPHGLDRAKLGRHHPLGRG